MKNKNWPYEEKTVEQFRNDTAKLVAQDVAKILKDKTEDIKNRPKFYKRGVREFYMVSKNKVMRIVNGGYKSEVTILIGDDTCYKMVASMITEDALEGTEITREEFAKEFEVASRLIVMEP